VSKLGENQTKLLKDVHEYAAWFEDGFGGELSGIFALVGPGDVAGRRKQCYCPETTTARRQGRFVDTCYVPGASTSQA
jgi:hypothetical protein